MAVDSVATPARRQRVEGGSGGRERDQQSKAQKSVGQQKSVPSAVQKEMKSLLALIVKASLRGQQTDREHEACAMRSQAQQTKGKRHS